MPLVCPQCGRVAFVLHLAASWPPMIDSHPATCYNISRPGGARRKPTWKALCLPSRGQGFRSESSKEDRRGGTPAVFQRELSVGYFFSSDFFLPHSFLASPFFFVGHSFLAQPFFLSPFPLW